MSHSSTSCNAGGCSPFPHPPRLSPAVMCCCSRHQNRVVPKSKKVMPPLGALRVPPAIEEPSTQHPKGLGRFSLVFVGCRMSFRLGPYALTGGACTGCPLHPVYILRWSVPPTLTPFVLPLPSTHTYTATWWDYVHVESGFACRDGHVSMYASMCMTPPRRGKRGNRSIRPHL